MPRNRLAALKQMLTNAGVRTAPRACFVYYMRFENSAVLYREARALRDAGYEVDVICQRELPDDPIWTRFDGLRLFRIQARPAPERAALRYFYRLGFFFLKTAICLSILSLVRRYRVVHVTSPPDAIAFTALVPKLRGARILLDIHDIGPELFMRKLGVARTIEAGVIAHYILGDPQANAFVAGCALTSEFIKSRPDVARRFAAAWEKAARFINENPAEARKHLVKNTFTPEDVVDSVPMVRYFMAKDLTDKDKADYQKFIDFSVETGTLEQKVDVTRYLQAF